MVLIGLFICGGASMLLLSLYDVILVKTLKLSIPLNKVFRLSYIINAFNAIVGFGGFIGAGFRTFIYKNYTSDRKSYFNHISFTLLIYFSRTSYFRCFSYS